MGEKSAELEFLIDYVIENCFDEEICRDRLRILWTAFCLHHDLDVDTDVYDHYLLELWCTMEEVEKETPDWYDFGSFELYMAKYLV